MAGFTNIISNAISNEWEKEASQEQYERQLGLSANNAAIAMRNWKATNFAEQRRQMERAGLSVGLMYGKGGGQGGVSSTPPGQIQKRNVVPLDVNSAIQASLQQQQLKLQQQQIEANVKNTEADTKLKEQEVQQKAEGGIEYESKAATIENIKKQTENKAMETEIMEYEKEIKRIEANIANETERDIVFQQKAAASKLMDEARSTYTKANIDQATQETQIELIRQNAKEQTLRMLVMKLSGDKLIMDTEETQQKISKLSGEIDLLLKEGENIDARTANEKQKLLLDKIANEFLYGDEAKAIRLINAYRSIFPGISKKGAENLNKAKKP